MVHIGDYTTWKKWLSTLEQRQIELPISDWKCMVKDAQEELVDFILPEYCGVCKLTYLLLELRMRRFIHSTNSKVENFLQYGIIL